jgi:CheY-like chemotaxis protein
MTMTADCRERGDSVIDAVMTETPSTDITAPRVLLAEDDVDARELLAMLLRDAGYEVEEAGDGREALASIVREPPSLLITDCNMPNMSGNELVELLALDARLRSIPAIVISALKQLVLPANVIVFLTKPFKVEQLLRAVRDCLDGSPADCPAA